MARKSSKTISRAAQRERYKKDVRRLQSLGLYTGKPDLRRKPTRSALKAIAKYKDVLQKKATVIEAPSGKAAAKYGFLKRRGRKIVVPRQKGERVSISKTTGEIKTTRKVAGRKVTKRLLAGAAPRQQVEAAPGKRGYWVMPIRQGRELTRQRFENYEDLRKFMLDSMSGQPGQRFEDWEDYVEFEELDEEG